MRILICEDNPIALKTLIVVLKREGFEADAATDGNAALSLLQQNEYDMMVIDIHLPYHSGLELLKFVRTDQKRKTPALILSAFSDLQMKAQAKELGIEDYIVKPFNPSDLINKIRSILKN